LVEAQPRRVVAEPQPAQPPAVLPVKGWVLWRQQELAPWRQQELALWRQQELPHRQELALRAYLAEESPR
jgi:hypothetical protein